MAMVDFSNAQLHLPNRNVLNEGYASLENNKIYDASGNLIVSNYYYDFSKNQQNEFIIEYVGSFTASGTEFYFGAREAVNQKWKMTGISFQAGDTYSFQIPVTLTCN